MKEGQIKRLLPTVFQRTAQRGSPLAAILSIMEGLQGPSEFVLEHLDRLFDPYRTPDEFVPYLASWVDLTILMDGIRPGSPSSAASLSTGLGRLRELTAGAVPLSHWRGTRKGLCLFLETATGKQGFEVDEHVMEANGTTKPFHLRVTAPGELSEHQVLIERIIELEKPAYVTYELKFRS